MQEISSNPDQWIAQMLAVPRRVHHQPPLLRHRNYGTDILNSEFNVVRIHTNSYQTMDYQQKKQKQKCITVHNLKIGYLIFFHSSCKEASFHSNPHHTMDYYGTDRLNEQYKPTSNHTNSYHTIDFYRQKNQARRQDHR